MDKAETVTLPNGGRMATPRQPPSPSEYYPSQRVTLNDLSTEILIRIATYVRQSIIYLDEIENEYEYNRDVQSLLRLMLCSHRLKQIAEPVLYNEFQEPDNTKSSDKGLVRFMCAIVNQPHLRTRVKCFLGRARGCEHGENPTVAGPALLDVSEVTEDSWTSIEAAMESLSPGDGDYTFTGLRKGCWEGVTAFVLCLLPNLEYLKFQDWGLCDYPSLEAVFDRAVKAQDSSNFHWKVRPLGHLRHYSLRYWDTEGSLGLASPQPLLHLKSLRSISMQSVTSECEIDYSDDDETIEDDTAYSGEFETFDDDEWLDLDHISNISLYNSAIDHRSFKSFLHRFPKLEILAYEYGGATVGDAAFEPPKLMKAFMELNHCLRDLQVIDCTGGGDSLHSYPFGSFASFSKLKHLKMSAKVLLGDVPDDEALFYGQARPRFPVAQTLVDALPESLESLTLYECREQDVPRLFEFVLHATRFKSFATLVVHWSFYSVNYSSEAHTHPVFFQRQATEFLELCEAAGWSFTLGALTPNTRLPG